MWSGDYEADEWVAILKSSVLFKRKRKVCVKHKNRNAFCSKGLKQQLWETTVNMTGSSCLVLFMIIQSFITTVRMMRALFHCTLDTKKRERTINLFLFQEIEVLQNMISDRALKKKSSSLWVPIFIHRKQKRKPHKHFRKWQQQKSFCI